MTNSKTFLKKNIDYLSHAHPQLVPFLPIETCKIDIQSTDHHKSLLVNGEEWIEDLDNIVEINLYPQIKSPNRVFLDRVSASKYPQQVDELLGNIIDSEDLITLDQLPSLVDRPCLNDDYKNLNPELAKDSIILGSLALLYIDSLLLLCPHIESFLLVESDPKQFYAMLHLVDFEQLIYKLKENKKGFSLVFQPNNPTPIGVHILDHYANNNPLALNGLVLYQSPKLSPDLVAALAWCHSPDGLLDQVKGFLGNDTDEINQTLQAIWNIVLHPEAKILSPDIIEESFPLAVIASGPSLDDNLDWLRDHQDQLTMIASASSLGSLVRAGITPDILVLLEMSSIVFDDIAELYSEGYSLSDIILISSSSIDPRVPLFFSSNHIFFHRPLLAPSSLFDDEREAFLPQAGPQAANAALEVALQLGSRNLLLFGCDFACESMDKPRSANAMGTSPRDMTLPIRGRLGKTVYTTPQLSTTCQFFENIINLYGANVVSIGNGAYMKSVKAIQSADDLPADIISSLKKLSKKDANNSFSARKVTPDKIRKVLVDSLNETKTAFASLRDSLDSFDFLSYPVARILASYLSWNDGSYPPSRRLVHRLSRFLLFFSLQPFHDRQRDQSINDPQEKQLLYASFDQIEQIIILTLKYSLSVVDSTVTAYHYNLRLIRKQIKKISLSL